jgi:hypothetical protein
MRRGMPSIPAKCIGKNVRFMPTKVSQKCQFPCRSFIIRPYIFGK